MSKQPINAPAKGSIQTRRAALASFIGTTIEWYDFYVYATAAALVFGPLFFSNLSPFMATLASFGTFAVGFFARPFGGVVFGSVGDRFGRKKALVITLLIMGVVTMGIGMLPTFATAGYWAPAALILLRFMQGIAVGGEWGGAVLLAAEHAPNGRRTFFASFAQLGSPAGMILCLAAFRLASLMDKAEFMAWGWRLPFLASVVLLVVGLAIRLGVQETPDFEQNRDAKGAVASPVRQAFTTRPLRLVLAVGANTFGISAAYLFNTFMIAYTTQYLGIARATILDALFITAIAQFMVQPIAARIAEQMRSEKVFLQATLLLAMVTPYPLFLMIGTKDPVWITLGLSLNIIGGASFYSVIAGYLAGTFPTSVRYTSISIAYQFCGAIAGGLTPLIGTVIAESFKEQWWPMAVFGSALAGVSLICVTLLDRYRHDAATANEEEANQARLALDPA